MVGALPGFRGLLPAPQGSLIQLLGPAPQTDAIVDAAAAYVAFRSDVEAIGAAPLATAADLDRALQRAGRHNPDAMTRGWIAYGALIAEKAPAFAAGVRAVSQHYGRTAVLRALESDPAYSSPLRTIRPGMRFESSVMTSDLAASRRRCGMKP